ncbi:AAA family ATPase [Nocardia sp. NPDC051756]|uniref:AAA family ATPase n=1 Tax=Nocardia sp. NPDC051756 TaxID=3154751 RepID=UPI0034336455
MGGRLALVVGSECAALGELGFAGSLATELHGRLRDVGEWRAATATAGAVLNPTAAQLVSVIDEAFATASAQQATLLIAFVGHGAAIGDGDFFLLAHDSPAVPNSQNAFHLAQGIRERIGTAALDGLIVLIDACETGQGVQGAARRWADLLAQSYGRMEMLVAADEDAAFGGCFTRTLLETFASGLPLRGENLLPGDLIAPIAHTCRYQFPQHLSFTAGVLSVAPGSDPGLWLVPNNARRRDALTGRPAAGLVDQLTRKLLLTDTIRERLTEIVESGGHRLRAVVGPAGSGKSTLMALLIRPSLSDGVPISPEYVTAAIFLTAHSSVEAVAAELAAQLNDRLPGFGEARSAARDFADAASAESAAFDVEVCRPLANVRRPGTRVTILIDGLDQPEEGSRRQLIAAVGVLTCRHDLGHVRVIAGIREGTGVELDPVLGHMHRIALAAPTGAEFAAIVQASRVRPPFGSASWDGDAVTLGPNNRPDLGTDAGGWLLARLLVESEAALAGSAELVETELNALVARRVQHALATPIAEVASAIGPLLAVLVAAGAGPVLPIELLDSALSSFQQNLSPPRIRDIAVSLGALITRSRPGTAQESLGVAHVALLAPLTAELDRSGVRMADAHRAIIAATTNSTSAEAAEYARGSLAHHYLGCGDTERALAHTRGRSTTASPPPTHPSPPDTTSRYVELRQAIRRALRRD